MRGRHPSDADFQYPLYSLLCCTCTHMHMFRSSHILIASTPRSPFFFVHVIFSPDTLIDMNCSTWVVFSFDLFFKKMQNAASLEGWRKEAVASVVPRRVFVASLIVTNDLHEDVNPPAPRPPLHPHPASRLPPTYQFTRCAGLAPLPAIKSW